MSNPYKEKISNKTQLTRNIKNKNQADKIIIFNSQTTINLDMNSQTNRNTINKSHTRRNIINKYKIVRIRFQKSIDGNIIDAEDDLELYRRENMEEAFNRYTTKNGINIYFNIFQKEKGILSCSKK